MNLRKSVLAFSITLVLTASTATLATGIPTVDVAAIGQQIANNAIRVAEFAENIAEAKRRFDQLKATADHYKDMVEGHFDFENVLSDLGANDSFAKAQWSDVLNDVAGLNDLREAYGLLSDNSDIQKRYDYELKKFMIQQKFYESAYSRNSRLETLLTQFGTAETPAKKADIANAINFEHLLAKNDSIMMDNMNNLMEKQALFEVNKSANETIRLLSNEGIPRS